MVADTLLIIGISSIIVAIMVLVSGIVCNWEIKDE